MDANGVLELMDKIAREHRLCGVHDEDARYIWPERWSTLYGELEQQVRAGVNGQNEIEITGDPDDGG